jgi:uncharacterized membrane protein
MTDQTLHPDSVINPKDIADDKALAAISYLGVLCLISLFFKRDSNFVQFHAKQGTMLFVVEIILWFINVIPFLGQLIWFFGCILFIVISIKGIVSAWRGEYWEIPYLSEYAKKINI